MEIFDIYTNLELPAWLYLFIATTVLPYVTGLATKLEANESTHKLVNTTMAVAVAVIGLVVEDMLSIANIFLLAAPGAIISSKSYDSVWKFFRINDFLAPSAGVSDRSA